MTQTLGKLGKYDWVSNPAKFEQAWKILFEQNQILIAEGKNPVDITEETLKVEYELLQGKVK